MRPDQWYLPVGSADGHGGYQRGGPRDGHRGRCTRSNFSTRPTNRPRQRIRAGEQVRLLPVVPTRLAVFGDEAVALPDQWGESDGGHLGDPAGARGCGLPQLVRPALGEGGDPCRGRSHELTSSPSANGYWRCLRAEPRTSRSRARWASRCVRCVAGSPSSWPSSVSTPVSRPAWRRPGAAGSEPQSGASRVAGTNIVMRLWVDRPGLGGMRTSQLAVGVAPEAGSGDLHLRAAGHLHVVALVDECRDGAGRHTAGGSTARRRRRPPRRPCRRRGRRPVPVASRLRRRRRCRSPLGEHGAVRQRAPRRRPRRAADGPWVLIPARTAPTAYPILPRTGLSDVASRPASAPTPA